jgi:hypothetical protein
MQLVILREIDSVFPGGHAVESVECRGLPVRIPMRHRYLSVVNIEVFTTGRSLVQGIPTECECLCVCVSLSVIRCKNNPLHLKRIPKRN